MNEAVSRLEYLRFRPHRRTLSPTARIWNARGEICRGCTRARINVTGGSLIDDVIIIMHDYVARADRGMTSTCGRYTARTCRASRVTLLDAATRALADI
jgi:hypothetical protein